MISSAFASSGYTPSTTAPTAAPSSVSIYIYQELLSGVQWTNGDPLAETEIGYRQDEDALLEPTAVYDTVAAGVTSWESDLDRRCHYWIRHSRGGQQTAWVLAVNTFGCSATPLY